MTRRDRYRNQPLDTSSRHSIRLHVPEGVDAQDGAALASKCEHVKTDYFYHGGQYWTAMIPLAGVDSIYGQVFNFSKPKTRQGKNGPEVVLDRRGTPKRRSSIVNHLQTRFRMKRETPVELFPMQQPAEEPAHRIDDFVYSVEAVGPMGVRFNLSDAISGSFTCAHRFLSTQEMVFERLVVEGMSIAESPALPLSEDERKMALALSLVRSSQAGMTERYYLYRCCGTNNCTSNPFEIVDRVVTYNWLQRIGAVVYRLPLMPRLYLRVRGLDPDPSYYNLLRSEFEAFIAAPETQARKRSYVKDKLRQRRAALGRPEKRKSKD